MALAYGLGGGIGVILGGALADRIVRLTGDPRWYTRGCAAAVAASLPCALLAYGAATTLVAGTALVLFALLNHLFLGPVTAQIQNLFAPRRRAVAAAVYLLLVNLISMGLGPLLVGIASDTLTPRLGDAALRYALALVVSATSVLAAFHFLRAGRTLAADLARVRRAS
jgi:MFS family permease